MLGYYYLISEETTKEEQGMQTIRKLVRNCKGATAIEYGLIAALIAVAAITAMSNLGSSLNTTFDHVADNMQNN